MNTMIKYAYILYLLIVTMPLSSLHAEERVWGLEVNLTKHTYILHEPIWLDVTLTNNSSDTMRTHGLDAPNYRGFGIEVRDVNGDLLRYTGAMYTFTGGPGRLLLKSGEQDADSFNLLELYGLYDANSGYRILNWVFPYIPAGMYSVKVCFEDAVSNELTFEIVNPSGEEREVLELIAEASGVYAQDNSGPSVEKFRDIVEKYPHNVFAEECYYFARANSPQAYEELRQGTFDRKSFNEEMLMKYPNSGRTRGLLTAVTWELDDSAKMDVFNSIIEEKAHTRAARYAKLERDRLLRKQERDTGE